MNSDADSELGRERPSLQSELGRRIGAMADLHKSTLEAAQRAGISRDQLYSYIKGESKPSLIAIAKLAESVKVRMDWVCFGKEPMLETAPGEAPTWTGDPATWPADAPLPSHLARVPLLNTVAALGVPVENHDEAVVDWAVVPKADVPHPSQSYALRVAGDSMHPVLQDGWLVGVDACLDALAPLDRLDGKLVVARLDAGEGGISVKWCRVGRHSFTLEAENPRSGFQPVILPYTETARILAKITWVFGRW